MSEFYHGPEVNIGSSATLNIAIADMSAIGMVTTSADADATIFPQDIAVAMPDFSAETLTKCGTEGTQLSAVKTLLSQNIHPKLVIVRVDAGADEAEKEANVLAGLETLKAATSQFGFDVEIIIAPGLETLNVLQKIGEIAQSIDGYSAGALPVDSFDAAIALRPAINKPHMSLLYPATVKLKNETVYLAALLAAARVMIDHDTELGIQKSISNVQLKGGVDDIGEAINYIGYGSIANKLNAAQITTIIRKSPTDFRFYGNRHAGVDADKPFETDIRIGSQLTKMLIEIFEEELDAEMSAENLSYAEKRIKKEVFQQAEDKGIINGWMFVLDKQQSTEAVLSQGGIIFNADFGTNKPLENPVINLENTNKYLPSVLARVTAN